MILPATVINQVAVTNPAPSYCKWFQTPICLYASMTQCFIPFDLFSADCSSSCAMLLSTNSLVLILYMEELI